MIIAILALLDLLACILLVCAWRAGEKAGFAHGYVAGQKAAIDRSTARALFTHSTQGMKLDGYTNWLVAQPEPDRPLCIGRVEWEGPRYLSSTSMIIASTILTGIYWKYCDAAGEA